MKKLLSLLTIPAIATSVPAPLLANVPVERVKRDINKLTPQLIRNKRKSNKVYDFKIKGLKKVKFVIPKQKNNIKRVNILKMDNINLNGKLPELRNLENLSFLFTQELQNNQDKQEKIRNLITTYGQKITDPNGPNIKPHELWIINKKITIKAQGTNLKYFEYGNDKVNYQLKSTNNFEVEIERDSTDDLDWVKQQSQFNLIDGSKTKTWTRPDLITVDGELNIAIANPNIDKVIFDNVLQPQTAKQWNINIKPETSEKDHKLQVFFTLDGKQYTSEIMVSMQAKIDPPKPIVKENLDKVIKFADENNLGNILDNNNETIIAAITQKNSLQVDFSQIEFDKKDIHSATLTAKPDSKSYQGSVVVKYNVVPATIVDLKIDLQPTSPTTQVIKDYVGQIDTSTITSPVNTFYYANSESIIKMIKPTPNSVITGVVFGCDEQWNKTSQHNQIDPTNGIVLDGSQLATNNGKYVVELSDNLGHTNNIYLQISSKQAITNYFDTDNGKQFEQWAKANGHDDIRGYSSRQLNKLFEDSKNWQQLASDSQFANALADWFKTNGKLASKEPLTKEQVIAQLKTQMPKTITIDKFDTSNYDFKKVEFELNQNEIKPNEIKPNEPVDIAVKYDSEKSDSFTLQIENSNPPNNNKKGLTGWAIIGVIIGALSGLLLLGWLFKKFVVTPFILEPIRKKKAKAFQRQTEKDIAQMKAEEKAEQEKNK